MRSELAWLAAEAALADAIGVDGEVAYTPAEVLLETLHTVALAERSAAEDAVREAEAKVTRFRRRRILPNEDELRKIGRYEAHLSREMYRALHELEALQTRRQGGSAPLARLDVEGLSET